MLADDADLCKRKMMAAEALINGLSGERIRWTEQSRLFRSQIDKLVGDVMNVVCFLSYCGPFNQEFRNIMKNRLLKELLKRKIPMSGELNITNDMVDPTTVQLACRCVMITDVYFQTESHLEFTGTSK